MAEDLAQGTWYGYYESGEGHFSIDYERGVLHGAVRRWAKNGQVIYEATNVDDVLQGPYTRYYPTGQIQETCGYLDGQRHGDFVMYDEDGEVVIEMEFDEGEPIFDEKTQALIELAEEQEAKKEA